MSLSAVNDDRGLLPDLAGKEDLIVLAEQSNCLVTTRLWTPAHVGVGFDESLNGGEKRMCTSYMTERESGG